MALRYLCTWFNACDNEIMQNDLGELGFSKRENCYLRFYWLEVVDNPVLPLSTIRSLLLVGGGGSSSFNYFSSPPREKGLAKGISFTEDIDLINRSQMFCNTYFVFKCLGREGGSIPIYG